METKLRHFSESPVAIGLPEALPNPIKAERFAGEREAQLVKAVGTPSAHHFLNESRMRATMLVVGSRRRGQDTVHDPDDGLGPTRG
jgi:hypothetical protein